MSLREPVQRFQRVFPCMVIGVLTLAGHVTAQLGLAGREALRDPLVLDRADFRSTADWIDAMNTQGLPGIIGSGLYDVSDLEGTVLTQSIIGHGDPVFDGNGSGNFLYLQADGITIQGVGFTGIEMPIISVDTTADGWARANFQCGRDNFSLLPPHLYHDAPIRQIAVQDCTFFDCVVPVLFVRETLRQRQIYIRRNMVRNSAACFVLRGLDFQEIYCEDNDIRQMQPSPCSASDDHTETIFLIGRVNGGGTAYATNTGVYVRRNVVEGYVSTHPDDGTNAAVCIDIRVASSIRIEDNEFIDCYSTGGSSDANAVYLKECVGDIALRRNRYENCGGPALDANNPGSEGMVYNFKGNCNDIISEDDTFVGGPNSKNNPMIAIGGADNVTFVRPTFEDWNNDGTWFKFGPPGMVRNWLGGPMNLEDPTCSNCGFSGGLETYFVIHRNDAKGPVLHRDWSVDFAGNKPDAIYVDVGVEITLDDCTTADGQDIQIDP